MKKIDRRWGFGKKEVSLGMILLGLGLFLFAPLRAQQEAKAVFVSMPDSLSPLLTAVNRADFIDFLESKMKAKVENRFGGESEMTDLNKDYIRIQMTPQVRVVFSSIPLTGKNFLYLILLRHCL